MLASVHNEIVREGLLLSGETVVVGVSGGNDSTALLHILVALNENYHYGWKLHAVHLNHCFRGDESRQDALYAQQLCERLGVAFHLFEFDVPAYMEQTGMGGQEASRVIRYGYYEQVAKEQGATKLALAHHADDQVETILFRFVRGARMNGLSGMPKRRWLGEGTIELVRPLLHRTREELEGYCLENGLTPREDSSNRSRKYKRNLLRLDVMPLLEQVNDRYREHILEAAESIRLDHLLLERLAEEHLREVLITKKQDEIVIDNDKFQKCDVALQRRMITLILGYVSKQTEWSSQHVEAVLHLSGGSRPSAELHLPGQLVVSRVYGRIHFCPKGREERIHMYCYELSVPGSTWIDESKVWVHTSYLERPMDWERLMENEAVFDAERLPGPLFLRNRKHGDRLAVFGSGEKKLKDVLIDAKVPRAWRDRLPLLMAGEEVILVPGVRRSAVAPVSEQTRRFLHVRVEFGEDWREVFS
ncbi:tRNA lysidine(34) synthetase TilS [Brevibacillus choshinensis]|uniref:tRNA(Ile)-lysidine synthase n=1 Tax=Brevibacillus choshinensis TaxID=54911 RepID=A0ABX7FNU1_BRECH|nr:tRNA lysidine(34) synthetase TilS [Brevibacillus choshinensis]QRG67817.1 tRNA lysidine(34) synthetase TilS [Brevibacillus choshinensis]